MSTKIKKLAVCICGEYRTWDTAADHIFSSMKEIASEVDYYFVTWNKTNQRDFKWKVWEQSTPVTEEVVRSKFTNENLVAIKIVDPNVNEIFSQFATRSFFYVAYLSKIANILKRKQEFNNGFIYDQVVEIRPDLFIPTRNLESLVMCDDFEYIAGEFMYEVWNGKIFGVRDLYIRTNSLGNDIHSARIGYKNPLEYLKFRDNEGQFNSLITENHFLLFSYLSKRNMFLPKNCYEWNRSITEVQQLVPIRPNFPDNFAELSYLEMKKFHDDYVRETSKTTLDGMKCDE